MTVKTSNRTFITWATDVGNNKYLDTKLKKIQVSLKKCQSKVHFSEMNKKGNFLKKAKKDLFGSFQKLHFAFFNSKV